MFKKSLLLQVILLCCAASSLATTPGCSSLDGPYCFPLNGKRVPRYGVELQRDGAAQRNNAHVMPAGGVLNAIVQLLQQMGGGLPLNPSLQSALQGMISAQGEAATLQAAQSGRLQVHETRVRDPQSGREEIVSLLEMHTGARTGTGHMGESLHDGMDLSGVDGDAHGVHVESEVVRIGGAQIRLQWHLRSAAAPTLHLEWAALPPPTTAIDADAIEQAVVRAVAARLGYVDVRWRAQLRVAVQGLLQAASDDGVAQQAAGQAAARQSVPLRRAVQEDPADAAFREMQQEQWRLERERLARERAAERKAKTATEKGRDKQAQAAGQPQPQVHRGAAAGRGGGNSAIITAQPEETQEEAATAQAQERQQRRRQRGTS